MSILLMTLIILYCTACSAFHYGIKSEWEKDVGGELDHLNPSFIRLMIVCTAVCWPLLVLYHLYLKFKNKE
jgi:hypothetical protein